MIAIVSRPYGVTSDGRQVEKFILKNSNGMQAHIISYACAVQSIIIPDKNGAFRDVVLGYDDIKGYEKGSVFLGAFVGRYANRIKNAAFTLNGIEYQLEKNSGENHLHGIYAHEVFDGKIEDDSLVFRHVSPAFDEGYPGNLNIEIRYTLTNDNILRIEYVATTDSDTVINLTNHSYFNLNGQDGSDILGHELYINSDSITEINSDTIPTGQIISVNDTPLDFRVPKTIGRDINSDNEQLRFARGYDHNYILNGEYGGMKLCSKARSDKTGIGLICRTTQPAVHFYIGNYLDTDKAPCGKNGIRYSNRGGFCLETQHYPCSPNFDSFPSTVLRKGEVYHQITQYQFVTDN